MNTSPNPTKMSVEVAPTVLSLVSKYNLSPAVVGSAKNSCLPCMDPPSLSTPAADLNSTSPFTVSAYTATVAPASLMIVHL